MPANGRTPNKFRHKKQARSPSPRNLGTNDHVRSPPRFLPHCRGDSDERSSTEVRSIPYLVITAIPEYRSLRTAINPKSASMKPLINRQQIKKRVPGLSNLLGTRSFFVTMARLPSITLFTISQIAVDPLSSVPATISIHQGAIGGV